MGAAISLGTLSLWGFLTIGCAGPGAQRIESTIIPKSDGDPCTTSKAKSRYYAADVCAHYTINQQDTYASQADALGATIQIAFVENAIEDSRRKCKQFIAQFTSSQAAENTSLDVLGLILSGLATVFTPASTVRGLAAASTAVQGTKQAINTDIFQQMTVLLLMQQIKKTYYDNLSQRYASFPPTSSLPAGYASGELLQIEAIHDNCSIPISLSNLDASSGKAPTAPTVTTSTVKISGPFTVGDTITLTASSKTNGLPRSVSYKLLSSSDNAATIANKLILAVHNDMTFSGLGISALPGSSDLNPVNGTSAEFTLQGGPSDISWAITGQTGATEKVTVSSSGS
jgi:hypothetical protein